MGTINRLKSSINEVIDITAAKRPIIAPFIFFLYLYINAHTVEKIAVERKSIMNPQNPESPIEINSINDTANDIPIEHTGPKSRPAIVTTASFASKVRNMTFICIINVDAIARAQNSADIHKILIF